MKKDISFILLVLAVGALGIFLTRNNVKDEILLEKNEQNAGRGSYKSEPADSNLNITYTSARTYRSNAAPAGPPKTVDLPDALPDPVSEYEDPTASDEPQQIPDEYKPKPKTWSQLYDAWYVVLVDSSSSETNWEQVNSIRECELIVEFKTGQLQLFAFDESTQINESKTEVSFSSKLAGELTFDRIDVIHSLSQASSVLNKFCKQR